MRIGTADSRERVVIVAEIGNNHEGDFARAQEMVRAAAASGVDAVKFQTFRAVAFTAPTDPARFARLQRFELPPAQFEALGTLARSLGIAFFSTPLDLGSEEFLAPIADAVKIASGDNDFWALIERAAGRNKPLIISTGLADLPHLRRVRQFVRDAGDPPLAFLHCVAAYPVPAAEADLRAISLLAREFPDVTIGYSDHTMGVDACVAATALGARILEKHFTLDKNLSEFRDHQLSADPAEMRTIVERVRATEALLGREEKSLHACEEPIAKAARRSIVAARALPAGHRIEASDLTWMRPAGGLRPGDEARLIGRTLRRAVGYAEIIATADVAEGKD
jgi:N,N'-diacetyllegionaminate synthase